MDHDATFIETETSGALYKYKRKVKYRSDSAGYQTQPLRYLAEGQDARFGVIEFASVVSGMQGVPEIGGGGP